MRAAHALTGTATADFSRIRNADLTRFTLDRLVGIINRLGSRVEVKLKIRPAARAAREKAKSPSATRGSQLECHTHRAAAGVRLISDLSTVTKGAAFVPPNLVSRTKR